MLSLIPPANMARPISRSSMPSRVGNRRLRLKAPSVLIVWFSVTFQVVPRRFTVDDDPAGHGSYKNWWLTQSPVGAGLPAKAMCLSAWMSTDRHPSLASQLLQGGGG